MNNLNKVVLTFTCFLILNQVQLSFSQDAVKYFEHNGDDKTGVSVQAIGTGEYLVTYTLPYLEISKITSGSRNFHILKIPGAGYIQKTGYPLLPVFQMFLDATGYQAADAVVVQMDTAFVQDVHVIPAQQAVLRNASLPIIFDQSHENQLFYSSGKNYPDRFYSIKGIKSIGNGKVLDLCINPVIYNPLNDRIIVVKKITLKVSLETEKTNKINSHAPIISGNIRNGFNNGFIRASSAKDTASVKPFNLLILTHDEFYDSIQPFVEWKKRKGYHVSVLKTSQIADNPSDSDIKKALQDSFDAGSLQYVLLVGDVDYIPAFKGVRNALNDHGYTTLQGTDYLPDIVLGRFSVNDSRECSIYVRKLLKYEKYPDTLSDPSWYSDATSAASSAHLDDWHGRDVVHFLKNHHFIQVDDFRASINRFKGINVLDALDSGRSWFFYIGHGTSTGFSIDGGFGLYEVDHLNNYGRIPAVVSVACATGDIDYPSDCLGERFMNISSNRGASVFLGATEDTYFFWSDTLGKYAMFSYISGETETFGDAMNYGKLKMYECFPQDTINSESEETMQHFIILGDPTIMPWTEKPKRLVVNYPKQLVPGTDSLVLTVLSGGLAVKNALVSLTDKNFTFAKSVFTDSNGYAKIQGDFPKTGKLYLVVSGRDLFPVIDSILVDTGSGFKEEANATVNIYPNPFNEWCIVDFGSPHHSFIKAELLTDEGEIIRSYEVHNQSVLLLDKKGLERGIYFLQIISNQKASVTRKIVIY